MLRVVALRPLQSLQTPTQSILYGDPPQSVGTIGNNFNLRRRHTPMNRRKKIKQLLEAHAKKANAKLAPKSSKPKYVSKADRAKLEAEAAQELVTPAE